MPNLWSQRTGVLSVPKGLMLQLLNIMIQSMTLCILDSTSIYLPNADKGARTQACFIWRWSDLSVALPIYPSHDTNIILRKAWHLFG